jgi:pyruvate,orthophosphate dikinase
VEELNGQRFGDPENPLLVSVRSGARVSMPGMMDTVLNLGLNDDVVAGLARESGDERFAWDCYRRFITLFGDVVLSIDRRAFDTLLDAAKQRAGAKTDADLPPEALKSLVASSRAWCNRRAGEPSRRIRSSSCAWPSTRCSTRGGPRRRSTTGASTGCPTTGAPR